MLPNLPRSHTAPKLPLHWQSHERNIYKSGLDPKHANYINYARLCYPSHAYIHYTNISHIHSSSPPLTTELSHFGINVDWRFKKCIPFTQIQCHPLFCWIPGIFPHNFKVMPEVNQHFTIILFDSHVEGVFPFALPQSPHAAAACCFLFALCWHTDAQLSPLLFCSQGYRPIRGQCG